MHLDQWEISLRYDDKQLTTSIDQVIDVDHTDCNLHRSMPEVKKDVWLHWIFKVVWDYRLDGKGEVCAWYWDDNPLYQKMGAYGGNFPCDWPDEVDEIVIYMDDYVVADNAAACIDHLITANRSEKLSDDDGDSIPNFLDRDYGNRSDELQDL